MHSVTKHMKQKMIEVHREIEKLTIIVSFAIDRLKTNKNIGDIKSY